MLGASWIPVRGVARLSLSSFADTIASVASLLQCRHCVQHRQRCQGDTDNAQCRIRYRVCPRRSEERWTRKGFLFLKAVPMPTEKALLLLFLIGVRRQLPASSLCFMMGGGGVSCLTSEAVTEEALDARGCDCVLSHRAHTAQGRERDSQEQ